MPPLPQSLAETPQSEAGVHLCAEDGMRADLYRLLARFLSSPPGAAELAIGAGIQGDGSNLGAAIDGLAKACRATDADQVATEFQDLFIGLARGEILPYGSYYLTGFLHEKPLARLRQDMERLGVERDPSSAEPEDHISSLLDIMAGLIDGSFGEPLTLDGQKSFFDAHIGNWAGVLFRDLEKAKAARLYAAVGKAGRAFMEVEAGAFRMV